MVGCGRLFSWNNITLELHIWLLVTFGIILEEEKKFFTETLTTLLVNITTKSRLLLHLKCKVFSDSRKINTATSIFYINSDELSLKEYFYF